MNGISSLYVFLRVKWLVCILGCTIRCMPIEFMCEACNKMLTCQVPLNYEYQALFAMFMLKMAVIRCYIMV